MKVGFTGTLQGMSMTQETQFELLLRELDIEEFHHGNAVGADTNADTLLRRSKSSVAKIVKHPAGSNPLDRNHEIIAAVDLLIAAPRTDKEQLRSGTWATVRYARAKGIPIIMLSRGR